MEDGLKKQWRRKDGYAIKRHRGSLSVHRNKKSSNLLSAKLSETSTCIYIYTHTHAFSFSLYLLLLLDCNELVFGMPGITYLKFCEYTRICVPVDVYMCTCMCLCAWEHKYTHKRTHTQPSTSWLLLDNLGGTNGAVGERQKWADRAPPPACVEHLFCSIKWKIRPTTARQSKFWAVIESLRFKKNGMFWKEFFFLSWKVGC